MNSANSKSMPQSIREAGPLDEWLESSADVAGDERDRVGAYPVLARLPDVSPPAAPARRTGAAAPFTTPSLTSTSDLRIDPPQPRGQHTNHRRKSPAPREARHLSVSSAEPRFREDERGEQGRSAIYTPDWRRAGSRSAVLPAENPFAIPRDRLQDSFAPVLRFVLLFALFTAAGTSILMIGQQRDTSGGGPATLTVDPTIGVPTASKPALVSQRTIEVLGRPTAAGPATLESESVPSVARSETITNHASEPAAIEALSPPAQAESHPTESTTPPYPTTNFAPIMLPAAARGKLPHVQTSDPPRAVASKPNKDHAAPTR